MREDSIPLLSIHPSISTHESVRNKINGMYSTSFLPYLLLIICRKNVEKIYSFRWYYRARENKKREKTIGWYIMRKKKTTG